MALCSATRWVAQQRYKSILRVAAIKLQSAARAIAVRRILAPTLEGLRQVRAADVIFDMVRAAAGKRVMEIKRVRVNYSRVDCADSRQRAEGCEERKADEPPAARGASKGERDASGASTAGGGG